MRGRDHSGRELANIQPVEPDHLKHMWNLVRSISDTDRQAGLSVSPATLQTACGKKGIDLPSLAMRAGLLAEMVRQGVINDTAEKAIEAMATFPIPNNEFDSSAFLAYLHYLQS